MIKVIMLYDGGRYVFIIYKVMKYIEDIQFFGMNMPFISSSKAKNAYFMSGKNLNILYILPWSCDCAIALTR